MYKGKRVGYVNYMVAYFFFYFSLGCFNSIMAIYLEGIDKSSSEVSFILSSLGVFTIFIQPMLGYFSDKLESPRRISQYALMIAVVTGGVFVFLRMNVLLFLFYGVTVAILMGVMPLLEKLAISSPYSYGKIRLWGSVGYAFSAQISSLIYQNFSSYVLFAVFVLTCCVGIYGLSTLKDDAVQKGGRKETVRLADLVNGLLKNYRFLLFLMLSFLFNGLSNVALMYFPQIILETGGNLSMVGTAGLLATLFEIPVLLGSDFFVKKISVKKMLILPFVIFSVRYFWYASSPSAMLIVGVFFFQALSNLIFIIVTNQILLKIVELRFMNTALSLVAMFGKGFGIMFFQNVLGRVLENDTVLTLHFYLGALSVVGILLAILFPLKEKKKGKKLDVSCQGEAISAE